MLYYIKANINSDKSSMLLFLWKYICTSAYKDWEEIKSDFNNVILHSPAQIDVVKQNINKTTHIIMVWRYSIMKIFCTFQWLEVSEDLTSKINNKP